MVDRMDFGLLVRADQATIFERTAPKADPRRMSKAVGHSVFRVLVRADQ